ncbi:MAG: hypothetical protein C4524_10055 [Candidatus Zixiibacteriota bacterium]|nr:MAG: hypothetical protein C4524_10055 [candidate division Zixibacteria bacterium]
MKVTRLIVMLCGAGLLLTLLGCAGTRKNDPNVLARSQRVQAAMSDIASAVDRYQDEHGYFPKGMATLRETGYLSIMPDLTREWNFDYRTDGGQVMMVEAVSTGLMPDGEGRRIQFRVPDDHWTGYGIDDWP